MTSEQIVEACRGMKVGDQKDFTMDHPNIMETVRLTLLLNQAFPQIVVGTNRNDATINVHFMKVSKK